MSVWVNDKHGAPMTPASGSQTFETMGQRTVAGTVMLNQARESGKE